MWGRSKLQVGLSLPVVPASAFSSCMGLCLAFAEPGELVVAVSVWI